MALRELAHCYQDRIFRLAYRVVGDATLAEEATALALVKIWERAGQWRGEATADTWIYRLAVRTVLDVRRSHTRWWRRWAADCLPVSTDPRPGPAEQMGHTEEQHRNATRVQRAIEQLATADRALVHLYYFENQSLGEIERTLGVPKSNLKMRLARAREKLKRSLGGADDDT